MTLDISHVKKNPIKYATNRVFYIDNIRIYLTILVILHHLAICYGGSGDWPIHESDFYTIDMSTVIILTLFNIVNQSYFMAFFFLLAGYFTPRSFEKKGTRIYVKDRFIRLGIPLVVYIIFVSPLVALLLHNYAYRGSTPYISLLDVWYNRIEEMTIGIDHLWFLLALLIFVLTYVLYRLIWDRYSLTYSQLFFSQKFPRNRVIVSSIGIIALITYIMRGFFLIGETIAFNFQLGHFTHYMFFFWVGIVAYHGKWFDHLSDTQAKQWTTVAGVSIPLLVVLMVGLIDFTSSDPFGPFLGGFTYQSLVYSIWETIALVSISITVLHLFQKKFNYHNPFLKDLATSTYTAYIIHALIIISFTIILLPVDLPAMAKFIIIGGIGVPSIFLISYTIRKVPFTAKILG
ncbi:MAG: acyltransferase family protein [Promethearchaeota archaeon]